MTTEQMKANFKQALHEAAADGWLHEADNRVNDYSRAELEQFAQDHPETWLGNVNLYGKQTADLVRYTGQMVYNFEYGFAVPANDAELVQLIRDRKQAPYTGTKDDYERIVAIENRIEAIGGINLLWS